MTMKTLARKSGSFNFNLAMKQMSTNRLEKGYLKSADSEESERRLDQLKASSKTLKNASASA